jgi:DNA-binding transcriptional ArsR family regulator
MNSRTTDADRLLHALADATRRDILRRTLVEELSVSTLAGGYPMSFAAVQKHVAVLERAGVVVKRRRGREQLVSGNVVALRDATRVLADLEDVWRGRVDRIADLLAQPDSPHDTPHELPEPPTEPQERP